MTPALTVATFNIRAGSAAGSVVRPLFNPTVRAVRLLGADIVALQEVDRRAARSVWRDQPAVLGRRLDAESAFGIARGLPGGGRYGVAMLSATPLSAIETLPLPTRGRAEPRVALMASTFTRIGRITIASTHLHNVRRPIPPGGGLSGRQLDDLLERIRHRPGPYLVMGDMNLTGEDVEPIAVRHGFVAHPVGPTFPASTPRRQIDWMLTADLDVIDAWVPEEGASDHRPIVARIERADHSLA